jgi:hypothetical protein
MTSAMLATVAGSPLLSLVRCGGPRRLAGAVLLCSAAALSAPAAAAPAAAPAPRIERVARIAHDDGAGSPAIGPRDAPVQVEFFYLPGPGNNRLPYQLIWDLWQHHPTRIRVTFRVLSRQGQVNLPAATLEAAAQGKFAAFMTAAHSGLHSAEPSRIRALAESVGMDLERLDAALQDGRHLAVLEDNERRRVRMRVRQLPEALFAGKLAARPISVLGPADLEAAYREAFERARDQLDRGVRPEQLAARLDAAALAQRAPGQVSLGPADERLDDDRDDSAFALLASPVRLDGLPAVLRPASAAAVAPRWLRPDAGREPEAALSVVVACNPLSMLCVRQLSLAATAVGAFDGGVRVVWAPMFDLRSTEAATAAQFADAILCAEALGFGEGALDLAIAQTSRRRGRLLRADALVDELIAEADLDSGAMAACLAVRAGDALRRAVALRGAGMALSPTVVIGGRMYPGGLSDAASLQGVIEDQLAPGWLGQLSVETTGYAAPAQVPRR